MKRFSSIVTVAAAMAAALVLGTGCGAFAEGALSQDVDPLSAVKRGQVGLPVLSLLWKKELSHHGREKDPQEFASPAIGYGVGDDKRLYTGSHDGVFYALHARTGRVMWKSAVGSVSSRPLVYRGRIFVGTDDGFMVCLDTLDGRELWRYATRGAILESPVLSDDTLFFSNEADQVYALSADAGKFRWQYKGGTPEEFTLRGHAGIVLDDGLLYTGFTNGTLVALRQSTGSVAWLSSLKGDAERFVDVDTTPVINGTHVLAASSAGGVYSLDKTTGLVRWRQPISNVGGIAVEPGRVYVAAAEQGVYALDTDGHVIWRQGAHNGGEPAAPLVAGDYLIYTLSDAGVYVADKRTGIVHQYFQPGDGVSAQPTLSAPQSPGMLYIFSNGGVLYSMAIDEF